MCYQEPEGEREFRMGRALVFLIAIGISFWTAMEVIWRCMRGL